MSDSKDSKDYLTQWLTSMGEDADKPKTVSIHQFLTDIEITCEEDMAMVAPEFMASLSVGSKPVIAYRAHQLLVKASLTAEENKITGFASFLTRFRASTVPPPPPASMGRTNTTTPSRADRATRQERRSEFYIPANFASALELAHLSSSSDQESSSVTPKSLKSSAWSLLPS